MTFDEFHKQVLDQRFYKDKNKVILPAIGLGEEAGEVLGKVKKWLRDDDGTGELSQDKREAIKEELGDVLWYVAALAQDLGFSLGDVVETNTQKLAGRVERNTVLGEGDNR